VPVRVLEQIKIDVCYENLPVVLIGDGAGLVYSHLGTSHQSTEDIACTRAIPALTVLSPADRYEMKAAMEMALGLHSPVYLRVGKSDRGDVHSGPLPLLRNGMLLIRKGSGRIAFLATGSMVRTALQVADRCGDADVWSVPCIKPMPRALLKQIAAVAEKMVSFEEHSVMGGLGACIAEELAEQSRLPLLRIGVEDRFSHQCGTWEYLIQEHGLSVELILPRIASFLKLVF
jgi:transketolase